jgi:hypothetical protein
MPTAYLKRVLDEACDASDFIQISASPDEVQFEAKNDLSQLEFKQVKGDANLLDIQVNTPSKARYNVYYLAQVIRQATQCGETAILEFSTDMPLKITLEHPNETVEYYQAPKMED